PARAFVKGTLPQHDVPEHIKHRYLAALAVRRFLNAQSFNWASFDAPDGIGNIAVKEKDAAKLQIFAGRAIRVLDWTGPHPENRNMYWWYSLLCDYVHPNVGASNLFVDVQEEVAMQFPNGQENRLYRRRLSRRPDDLSALTHVLSVIYLSLREGLSWT